MLSFSVDVFENLMQDILKGELGVLVMTFPHGTLSFDLGFLIVKVVFAPLFKNFLPKAFVS